MDEIKRLIERRQAQAVMNKVTAKLTVIAEFLGQPIVHDGTGPHDDPYDPFWAPEPEIVRTLDEADGTRSIGFHYDGLRIGRNFEIRHLTEDRDIRATMDGRVVYQEVEGEVTAYSPRPDWEELVERLYEQARRAADQQAATDKKEKKARLNAQAANFIQKLRDAWGF